MKALLAALLFFATPILAADVTIEWDDGNPPGETAKFIVELKTANGVIVATGDTVTTHFDFLALVPGKYTARAASVTAEGLHSDWSDAFVFVVPAKPGKLRIKVTVQTSDNNGRKWTDLATNYVPFPYQLTP